MPQRGFVLQAQCFPIYRDTLGAISIGVRIEDSNSYILISLFCLSLPAIRVLGKSNFDLCSSVAKNLPGSSF